MLELTEIEARVLGSLVEKSRTTPDYYPMTINALTAAANQTSNRDPVTDYSEAEVIDAASSLRERNLVRSVRTSRSRIMKHQHDLENALVIDMAATSLLAVLLLRGPQTVGELRTRTERYHDFSDLDQIEGCLTAMATDEPALVRQLERQPGQKEARWTQLLTTEQAPESTAPPPVVQDQPDLAARIANLEERVGNLERDLGI